MSIDFCYDNQVKKNRCCLSIELQYEAEISNHNDVVVPRGTGFQISGIPDGCKNRARATCLMMNSTLHTLLQSFQIPSDLARYENITDATILTRLNEWKRNAHHTLNEIRTLLRNLNASTDLSLQEQASVISVVAAFDGNDPWITPASRNSSRGMNGTVMNLDLRLPDD